MSRPVNVLAAVFVTGALLLSGCASTPAGGLNTADTVLRGASTRNTVTLKVTPGEVRTGEQLRADITASEPGYLYLYQLGTDGKTVNLVFPNAIDGSNYLALGSHSLPRPGWRMSARGPVGVGYFLAVVAARQQDLLAIEARVREGRIETEGPYAAAMTSIRELAP